MTCSCIVKISHPESLLTFRNLASFSWGLNRCRCTGRREPESGNWPIRRPPVSHLIKDESHKGKNAEREDQAQQAAKKEKAHAKHTEGHKSSVVPETASAHHGSMHTKSIHGITPVIKSKRHGWASLPIMGLGSNLGRSAYLEHSAGFDRYQTALV